MCQPSFSVLEISPHPYLAGDWCVDYTLLNGGEHTAHFDDQQAAQDWINANRLSVKEALRASLAQS